VDRLTDLDMHSGLSPAEVLGLVQARGRRLYRRRVLVARAVPAVAVIALAVPLTAALAHGSAQQTRVVTPATDQTTTTTGNVPSTTAAPAGTTTTAAPATSTTTSHPITTAPPATTTTTTAPAQDCTPSALTVVVATDQPSYHLGQNVAVTATIQNKSSTPCYAPALTDAIVRDSNGNPQWAMGVRAEGSAHTTPLGPGEKRSSTWNWNQKLCQTANQPCNQAPAGTYRAETRWGGDTTQPISQSTTFNLDNP